MDIDNLAQAIFGRPRAETQEVSTNSTTRTYTGVATSDSADGTVMIDLGGDVTLPDDLYDEDGNVVAEYASEGIEVSTGPSVQEGDEVTVTLVGGGALKTPMVTSVSGEGDRQNAAIAAAKTVADAAQAVAQAVNQHFFADTNGIHVTEATQEDWDENHTGANVLINSVGQLFRDGLNNLLTLTTQNGARALTIWDGLGNAAGNILARFSSDGISFADGTSFDIGDSSSYIHFDGNGHINIGGSGLTIGGYIPTGGVTVSDLTQAAQDATLNSNIVGGGANLIGAFNLYIYYNCKYDHSTGTMTSTTTTNTADNSVYLQFYNGSTYVTQYGSGFGASSVGELCGWTFEKTSEFNCIRLKLSGNKADAECRWDISSVADGTTITLSFRLDSISSDGKGNGGVMSGINLRAGTLRSEWSLAPQDETVGGRNLFVDTNRYLTTFNGSAFGGENSLLSVIPAGETITISVEINADNLVWASSGTRRIGCETSLTKTGGGNQYLGAWAGTSISQASNIVEVLDGTMHKRISKTFVLLGDMVVGRDINLYTQGVASGTLSVGRVKVELGDTATDWTPSPEDVDAAISDAAKTATSYVTEITGQNGIMVHPSTDQTTGVRITSDVDILRSGTSVANYGTTARIGTSAGKHVSIDSDSVDLMDGNASLATFGADETHLGLGGDGALYLARDKFRIHSRNWTDGVTDQQSTELETKLAMSDNAQQYSTAYIHLDHSLKDGIYDPAEADSRANATIGASCTVGNTSSSISVGATASGSSIMLSADTLTLDCSVSHVTEEITVSDLGDINEHTVTSNGACATASLVYFTLWQDLASYQSRVIGTLPVGYRPPTTVMVSPYCDSANHAGRCFVAFQADGDIRLYNVSGSTVDTGTRFTATATYVL